MTESSSPIATVGEEEIKRFRVGDILFSDEQAKMFCDLALKGLRAETRTSDRCEKCPSPKEGCIFPRCGEISREALEKAVIKAALDLFGATSSAAFKLPVPNTTPPLFVTCGEESTVAPSATPRITGIDVAMDAMRDAERYRWLRNHPKNGEKEWWPSVWMSREPQVTAPLQAFYLDDAIDAEIRKETLAAHMEGL